jgi:hypothetical protein
VTGSSSPAPVSLRATRNHEPRQPQAIRLAQPEEQVADRTEQAHPAAGVVLDAPVERGDA